MTAVRSAQIVLTMLLVPLAPVAVTVATGSASFGSGIGNTSPGHLEAGKCVRCAT